MTFLSHRPKQPSGAIIGLIDIGKFFGRSQTTVRRWIRKENFPAMQLPDGLWMTTPALIDQWIITRKKHTRPGK